MSQPHTEALSHSSLKSSLSYYERTPFYPTAKLFFLMVYNHEFRVYSLCSPIMPADWLALEVGIEPTLHVSRDTPRFLPDALGVH